MTRMKKGKKNFSQKKLYNKDFEKSKVRCFNYNKKVHYARECQENLRGKGIFNASTATEDETTQKNSFDEEYDDHRKEDFF